MVELARGRRVEEVNEREGQFTVFIMTLAWHFHADRHSERNVPRNKAMSTGEVTMLRLCKIKSLLGGNETPRL